MDTLEKRIEQIHFQITRSCNLRCYFCGQWGKNGFFSDAVGKDLSLEEWEKLISQVIRYREKTGVSPFIMLWGGEPLVSPHFESIVTNLRENDFKIGMVTNGVLMDRYQGLIDQSVDKLFVSLDGPPAIHDSIRGNGVFEKVCRNINNLSNPEIIVMSVVTEQLTEQLQDFLEMLNEINIKELYLQDMIGISDNEIIDYKKMMKQEFDIAASDIDGWRNNGILQFHEKLDDILRKLDKNRYHYNIYLKRHDTDLNQHCLSPFRHVHVAWNGDIMFCTDHYDFKAGNIKESALEEIFTNELSERFREIIRNGQCVTCRHCSWKNNRDYL